MRALVLCIALCAPSTLVVAGQESAPAPAQLQAISEAVSPLQLRASVEKLVSFGTRHTLSQTKSDTRGIGAARRWVESRFEDIAKDCDGCLQVVTPAETVTGKRVPEPTEVVDVIAIKRGSSDPDRVIVISGHLDSRVSDVMDASSDAPGANDDASGVAAVIEAARVLSKYEFPATLVFAALSGEEQGLYGGKLIAKYAVDQGWSVEAHLNNDVVGNSHGGNGVVDAEHVRVFSEGTKTNETLQQADYRRYHGGEVDSPSRNLARFMDEMDRYVPGLEVKMIYRTDRFGRGGDQVPMLAAGFPAVRVTESAENYARQHQDLRTQNGKAFGDVVAGVDFDYLAKVAALDAVSMAALAWAPMPPRNVGIEGAVGYDTTVKWDKSPGAASYRVWWRETTAPHWQHHRDVGNVDHLVLKDIIIDDWFFGVSAVSADGYASPVVFPGFAGSFDRSPAQPKEED